ncbi:hypothetical protein K469DRAFT_722946 [Zopfia rhizophila CBS 207.26]|uniref:Uncharacterized protein n=1 Tax=Zopfia rhizophila CBS 207.26 TaxID=1314779 RepID=A0A6A6EHD6_9PEZI|nr:hypothetical protein K469DRAFT_722946 [Zopfia rhizophila CBS 207.26]
MLTALSNGTSAKIPRILNPPGTAFANLKPIEEYMVSQCLNAANFTEVIIAPGFAHEMHKQAMCSFLASFDQVQDGYFSMYGALASARGLSIPGFDTEANLRRGALAIEKFRGLPCPKSWVEFTPWLWISVNIPVCSHCALRLRGSPARSDFGDTGYYDCLLHRQLPIMNIPPAEATGVDTFMGIYLPLMGYLFNLCHISYSIEARLLDALDQLEKNVDSWQPEAPQGGINDFSAAEVAHMLIQTRVHKTTVLLFVHRLKYGFGDRDNPAKRMTSSTLSGLDLTTTTTKQTPRWVTIPFFVAAIESTEHIERERILNSIAVYVDRISPSSREKMRAFLKALWEVRDRSNRIKWLDLMGELPLFCVSS